MSETSEKPKARTREIIAMEKLVDLDQESIFFHFTEIKKLEDILKEGLISERFAKRVLKGTYERGMSSSWNEDYVSLTSNPPDSINDDISTITIAVEPTRKPIKAKTFRKPSDKLSPFEDEYLAKYRIAPKDFKGIILYDRANIDQVVEIMKGLDEDLALPVYFLDDLVWPQQIQKNKSENSKLKK